MKLKERPIKIHQEKDFNPANNEKVMQHYDEMLRIIDNRRIAQITALSSDASLSDVIIKINEIITALNASDLTEES